MSWKNIARVLAGVLLLLPLRLPAQGIDGLLSSFTVTNRSNETATDFHVIVAGISCADIMETMGQLGWVFSCQDLPNGTVLLTWQGGSPVWPGQSLGLRVRVAGNPQWRIVAAYWTANNRVLFPMISWPNQRWDIWSAMWVDIVDGYNPPVSPMATIEREWTPVPMPIPLPGLTWDQTAMLPWMPSGLGQETIPNVPDSFFDIFLESSGMPALLVRYPVFADGNEVLEARYTNQVVLGDFLPPQLFSNFDVVNRGDMCANDFHVVLSGTTCGQLLGGPQGIYSPPGWVATCVDRPWGAGCEITWTSMDGSCVWPGDMRHFGYGINSIFPFQIEAAYWTWNGVPILPFLDVIQQTWEPGDFPGQWIDRVWGFPPLVDPWGVYVMREWAWTPQPIPLSGLDWEQTGDLSWAFADPWPQQVPPDPWFQLPFFFPSLPEGAARLIRYEVWGGAEELMMTFVNEAISGGVSPPIPPITDLHIAYLGDEDGQAHFRLTWTPPPSPTGEPLFFRVIGYDNPYDPSTESTQGYTVDSFFDIWTEIGLRAGGPPSGSDTPTYFRVTADYLPPER